MRLRLCAGLVAVAALYSGVTPSAQTPKLEDLIAKASSYVHQFVALFSNVVAEERYEQEITVPRRKRVLTGDFLLVRYPDDEFWQALRDVAEVDGKPVRDREDRILKLFSEPKGSAMRRAAEVAGASSRFNLQDIGNLNNPLLAMAFLQREYHPRFRFTMAGIEKKLGPDVRTVRFVEFQRPTLLKGNSNSDLPSQGLFWIEEGTGRVVQTELRLGGATFPIRIVTRYRFDEDLGINVPAQMEDWYPDGRGEFRGKATYGKFRRFEVQTAEELTK
jgi:hypothetical protein